MLGLIFIFLFGLLIGSFLNVCIYRLPKGESVVSPPSHCGACRTRLKAWDLVPVLSYVMLRGRCRYCGAVVSARYAVVELLTGLLFAWCLYVVGYSPEIEKAIALTAFLVVITFIDYDHQLILDKVLLWLAGTGVVINLLLNKHELWTAWPKAFAAGPPPGWLDMPIAALIGGGIMLLIAVVSRGGMGGGDIKFAAALGLWFGWKLTLLVLFLAFLAGGVGSVVLIVLRLKGRKDFIPFGPFIALAAFVGQLYGDSIIAWYLGYFVSR